MLLFSSGVNGIITTRTQEHTVRSSKQYKQQSDDLTCYALAVRIEIRNDVSELTSLNVNCITPLGVVSVISYNYTFDIHIEQ